MKKRSSYRPKHSANPLAYITAIQGAHKLCAHDQLTRAARVRCAVERLSDSTGDMADWRDVADALNMVEAFAHIGLVRDAREFVAEQQESMATALDRHKATGSNVLRPVECQLLRDLAATWAECLAEVTCRQYFEAEQRVVRKVQQALAKGSHGDVRVVELA
ncbi:MAG: hypothetical protein EOP39_04345 [Rubrivivax sp.]|nr:MAG: hypothetical protein EOP39_04345 [Rubrivivax sp.]